MAQPEPFTRFADFFARKTGRSAAFITALLVIVAWAVTGPLFGFSDTWQLVINTGTTIVTFLMVFLIQNTQNRETSAMQAKLDEIIISLEGADNRFIGIEHLSDRDLDVIVEDCERRARSALRTTTAAGRDAREAAAAKAAARKPSAKGRRAVRPRRSAAASRALAKTGEDSDQALPEPTVRRRRAAASKALTRNGRGRE